MSNKNKSPLVSLVTINYNQSKVTLDLLSSLKQISYKNIEIIVIDNNSPSDTPDIIKQNYPEIILIKSDINLGFAGGNNLGILHSKGDYILFINNDTEVEPNFIEPLVNAFEEDSTIGLVSPKIIFHHKKYDRIMQYAGGTEVNFRKGFGKFIGYGEVDTNQYESSYTGLIHGAAVMVPRELLTKVGVWPDMYFLYYEEIDWSEHFKREGYKLKYISESTIYHKESISIGKATPLRVYYMNRNRQLFTRRIASKPQQIISLLYFAFASVPKSLLYFLTKGEFKLFYALIRSIFWNMSHFKNLKQMPKLIEKNGQSEIVNAFYKY